MSKTQIPTGGIADDAISEEHIDATVITGSTALAATPALTDELLISDAGTIKRIDFTHLPTHVLLDDTYISSNTANVTYSSSLITDDFEQYIITGSGIRVNSNAKGNVIMYLSSDNGSSYHTTDGDYTRSVYVGQTGAGSNTLINRNGNASAMELTGNAYDFGGDGNAGATANFILRCYNLRNLDTDTGVNRYFDLQCVHDDRDSTHNVSSVGGFFFMDGTAEINNIKLEVSHSNTFGEGEFRLYGVR